MLVKANRPVILWFCPFETELLKHNTPRIIAGAGIHVVASCYSMFSRTMYYSLLRLGLKS